MNRNNSNPDADRRTIEKACGLDFVERYEADPARLRSTRDIRASLAEGIVLIEETVEPVMFHGSADVCRRADDISSTP